MWLQNPVIQFQLFIELFAAVCFTDWRIKLNEIPSPAAAVTTHSYEWLRYLSSNSPVASNGSSLTRIVPKHRQWCWDLWCLKIHIFCTDYFAIGLEFKHSIHSIPTWVTYGYIICKSTHIWGPFPFKSPELVRPPRSGPNGPWQRRAAAGASRAGTEHRSERRAERLQGILDRAAEYLAVDEVWKGEPLMMYVIYVIHVSIYLSDCLSIYLSIYLPVCLSVCLCHLSISMYSRF